LCKTGILSKFYNFSLKVLFYIDFAFFFLLSRKKEEKRLAKRRKKDRGRFLAARRKSSRNTLRVLGFWVHKILPSCYRNTLKQENNLCRSLLLISTPNLCEYFGLFSLEKSFDIVEKKYSRGDTKLCSHKLNSVAYLPTQKL